MKERTSTGISGLHFGHVKVCTKDKICADFEATMCHIPYATGCSPPDWKTLFDTMIEKKGKGNKVTDLCTINQHAREYAEQNNLLPKEQYGSRQYLKAILHAVNERLLYDLAQI